MQPSHKPIARNPEQNRSAAWNANTSCVSLSSASLGWQTASGAVHARKGDRLIFRDFCALQVGQEFARQFLASPESLGKTRWYCLDVCAELRRDAHWRVIVNRTKRGSFYGLFARMGNEQSADSVYQQSGEEMMARKRSNSLRDTSCAETAGSEVSMGDRITDVNLNTIKGRLKRSNTVHASAATTSIVKGSRDRIFTSPESSRTDAFVHELRKSNSPPGSASKRLVSFDAADDVCKSATPQTKDSSLQSNASPSVGLRISSSSSRLKQASVCIPLEPNVPFDGDDLPAVLMTECVTESEKTACKVNSVFRKEPCEVSSVDASFESDLSVEQRVISCGNRSNSFEQADSTSSPSHAEKLEYSPLERAQSLRLPKKATRASSFGDMTVMSPEEELAAALAAAERSRRSSDSSALKEEHIRRSEQFSEMLRQLKQKGNSSGKLSPYGLGVLEAIAEKAEAPAQVTAKPRCAHSKEYFDVWLKDQSDRISTLRGVLDGDSAKLEELRHKVRQSPLELESRHFGRSKSMKLPRRHLLSSEDDNCSSDSENSHDKRRPVKKHHSDTEAMRKQRHWKLSGMVSAPCGVNAPVSPLDQIDGTMTADPCATPSTPSDTALSDARTFATKKESIVFSKASTSSMTKGANVAVVKPMRQLAGVRSEISPISVTSAFHVSVTPSTADLTSSKGTPSTTGVEWDREIPCGLPCNNLASPLIHANADVCSADPVRKQAGRILEAKTDECTTGPELSRKLEIAYCDFAHNTAHPVVYLPSSSEVTFVPRIVEVPAEPPTQGDVSKSSGDSGRKLLLEVEGSSKSVRRISASLDQLMGDLRTLRTQDVDLAKQLIGLGRSIRRFRQERDKHPHEAEGSCADDPDDDI